MAFGRRSNVPSDGGDSGRRQVSPEAKRLADAMRAIFSAATDIAAMLRKNAPLPAPIQGEPMTAPIPCRNSEKLFEQSGDGGETLFAFYHSTTDFKLLDPEAQYKLSVLYQRVHLANMLINGLAGGSEERVTSLKPLLDEILVKSAFYIAFFESTSLATDILSGRKTREETSAAIATHVKNCAARLDEARQNMFEPANIAALAPEKLPVIAVVATHRYQEGQKTINGVYFPPQYAEPLLRKAAIAQGAAMRDRA